MINFETEPEGKRDIILLFLSWRLFVLSSPQTVK